LQNSARVRCRENKNGFSQVKEAAVEPGLRGGVQLRKKHNDGPIDIYNRMKMDYYGFNLFTSCFA
jgi:hypothetical protein